MCLSDEQDLKVEEPQVKTQPSKEQDDLEPSQDSTAPDSASPNVDTSASLPAEVMPLGFPSTGSTTGNELAVDQSLLSEMEEDHQVTSANEDSINKISSSDADEIPTRPRPSDHSPKSKVTWRSLERRRFNYDIMPKVFTIKMYAVS